MIDNPKAQTSAGKLYSLPSIRSANTQSVRVRIKIRCHRLLVVVISRRNLQDRIPGDMYVAVPTNVRVCGMV
jgi:hypothetical protein